MAAAHHELGITYNSAQLHLSRRAALKHRYNCSKFVQILARELVGWCHYFAKAAARPLDAHASRIFCSRATSAVAFSSLCFLPLSRQRFSSAIAFARSSSAALTSFAMALVGLA